MDVRECKIASRGDPRNGVPADPHPCTDNGDPEREVKDP